ncbi:pyridine nucleotide-disulfide oxidoreductase [Anaerocolumna cellulosilytica]|uniref:Pyridine nucleotide-disulfide oxidoreductase n=1 Tax=Anaerocolumna cellulosilytica TaxID=433286 RepID=A0A6S6R321_9FIRM|nr:FAD-dependent oxidoreductase [Anaerocolumna cellulosilytica]MBB5196640.1 NADPH-dependent glutamate synthase beta subunit-like oxidoreductase/NAD-dependent dihydropyrimidine dehydrogenase PreA subunit [Anaerocolumna cellulosilytica]BCJ93902.1 pyridine nucleotide-disulfide oxidoreductase [Anaerocolumna cellulosilytica]
MDELRPKIVKLAKMVGGIAGIMNKIDETSPEYYSLNCVVTDDMADIAMIIGLRKPRTFEYIAKHSGKSEEELRTILNQLAYTGVAKVWTDKEDNKDRYFVNIFAPGMLEMMVNNREQLSQHPEIGKAFEEYTRLRLAPMAAKFPEGMAMMRVIPVESAIKDIPDVKPWERLSYYLDKYDTFSVSDCSCRQSRRVIEEGCGHMEHEICIQMGEGAEYYIRTGRGRKITKEEAKEILKFAEDNGLMHEMPHTDGLGESAAICNCCGCSCFSLRLATLFNTPDAIRSNFTANVNKENCVACGQCVEHCPVNALTLGQKLCSMTSNPEKKERTSRNHIWRKDDWNLNYRENRQDVSKDGTSPCKTTCPAHISVQGYIKLAAQGRYLDALELIKKENPFPAVCGRICPHSCENECTRGDIDEPIAIDEIKKFIADKELDKTIRYIPPKRYNLGNKIAIIGSGPAGLSCAYYLAIDGYKVTVFEKHHKLGGMLTLGIPSFRLEKEVLNAEIDVLREMGVTFKTGIEVGKDITLENLRKEGYEAFYLAIGAQGGRMLNLEGEDAKGVLSGVEYLRGVSLGIQEELTGNIVVIGGGNVAIDVARTAARQNPKKVSLYCLESLHEMPALPEEISEAKQDNVIFKNGWGPKRILTKDGKVTGVEFKKCNRVFDKEHRFAPIYNEDDTIIVKADAVLLSIGQSIEWGNLLTGSKAELSVNNTLTADSLTWQTMEPDIFAGGDCCTGPKFAIHAIAAGKEAAISIHRYVQPGQSLVYGRDRKEYHSFDKNTISGLYDFNKAPRQRPRHSPEKKGSFLDDRLTFTEEQLQEETKRCLSCGAVEINSYMCFGCGMCTTKCKFDAIHLTRNYNSVPDTYEKLPVKIAANAIVRTGKIAASSIKEGLSRRG